MIGIISRIAIERSSLVIDFTGAQDIHFKNDNGQRINPSFCLQTEGHSRALFNLASCCDEGCIPSGFWRLVGAEAEQGLPSISKDFSKGSCRFEVAAFAEKGTLYVRTLYHPTKVGLRDRLTTLGLRLPYTFGKWLRGNKKRVLFASETRQSLSGNMQYVAEAAHENFGGNELICSFKSGNRLAFYLKTAFMAGRCHTVVVDDYFPLIYRLNFKNDRVIQLWHACGAFKTVGYSRLGKSGAPQPDDITHRNYTTVTVSGEQIIPYYAEAFGLSAEKIEATGVPRTDMFFDSAYADLKRQEFFDRFAFAKGKQVILFAPTFRGNGFNSAHYPHEFINFKLLGDYCRKNNAVIIFKMHPFIHGFTLPDGYEDVFADAGDVREINDILFAADLLITDYSSVIYEYSLLNKPLIFYVPDMEEYCRARDLYMPFEQYADGHSAQTIEQLVQILEEGNYDSFGCEHIRKGSMSACDGHSSKRVADLIFNT